MQDLRALTERKILAAEVVEVVELLPDLTVVSGVEELSYSDTQTRLEQRQH
jgi:hypothetical protein